MNTRKTVSRLCLSLLLAAGLFAGVLCPGEALAGQSDAEAVTATVAAFYKNYIASFDDMETPFILRDQAEIDPSFTDRIAALFAQAEDTEPGFLGYDPILMAQDVPSGMAFSEPVLFGDRAEIIAWTEWGEDSRNPLCVVAGKTGGVWRITDVIDMHPYEDEPILECGGMTRNPVEPLD